MGDACGGDCVSPQSAVRIVRGSARGVRVAGTIWAVFIFGMAMFMIYAYQWWEGLLIAVPASGFLAIRPWFMGVRLDRDSFLVKSWYRNYRIPGEGISKIDLEKCYSALVGAGTGFLPFAGKVRMIEVQTVKDDKERFLSIPSALGRYNTVLTVVREMRVHVGLPK